MHSTCVSDNRKRFYCHFCHFGFFLFMTSQALELHPFLTKVILFFILDFHHDLKAWEKPEARKAQNLCF